MKRMFDLKVVFVFPIFAPAKSLVLLRESNRTLWGLSRGQWLWSNLRMFHSHQSYSIDKYYPLTCQLEKIGFADR